MSGVGLLLNRKDQQYLWDYLHNLPNACIHVQGQRTTRMRSLPSWLQSFGPAVRYFLLGFHQTTPKSLMGPPPFHNWSPKSVDSELPSNQFCATVGQCPDLIIPTHLGITPKILRAMDHLKTRHFLLRTGLKGTKDYDPISQMNLVSYTMKSSLICFGKQGYSTGLVYWNPTTTYWVHASRLSNLEACAQITLSQ